MPLAENVRFVFKQFFRRFTPPAYKAVPAKQFMTLKNPYQHFVVNVAALNLKYRMSAFLNTVLFLKPSIVDIRRNLSLLYHWISSNYHPNLS